VVYITDELIGSTTAKHNWSIAYNKLIAYRLIQFEKIVLLDTDLFFNQNVDELMGMEDMSTAMDNCDGCQQNGMNAGLVVFTPSLDKWAKIKSYSKKESCLSKNFRWFDQELLICLYHPDFKAIPERLGDMKQIPYIYNLFRRSVNCKNDLSVQPKALNHIRAETKVYHFACSTKPYSTYKVSYSQIKSKVDRGITIHDDDQVTLDWAEMFHTGLSLLNVSDVHQLL
jgi:lipopolysaccharide biosynthesis glycosyltransferase